MKPYPVLLLCLAIFVSGQPEFFGIFDFSVAQMNGSADGKYSLYENMIDKTDTTNIISAEGIYGDGIKGNAMYLEFVNNKTSSYVSAIVVIDNEVASTRRRLAERQAKSGFKFQVSNKPLNDSSNLKVLIYLDSKFKEAFKFAKKPTFTVIALGINIQTSSDNKTKVTTYYMDSDNQKTEQTTTFSTVRPSLLKADTIEYDHDFGVLYYVAFSHKPVSKSVFETWVKDYLNNQHKKAECSNCKENFTCPDNSELKPSPLGMRRYLCACEEGAISFNESERCIKLVSKEKCDFGCLNACAAIDSIMCYENCTPGYNSTPLGNNFFSCTPIPSNKKSIWFWLSIVTIPIFIIAFIAKVIFFCYCRSSKSAPVQDLPENVPINYVFAKHSSTPVAQIVTGTPNTPTTLLRERNSNTGSDMGTGTDRALGKAEEEKEIEFRKTGMQDINDKTDLRACKMCNKPKKDLIAAFGCGHADVCKECALNIMKCPTCGDDTML